MTCVSMLVDHGVDIWILGNEHVNTLLTKFLNHTSQSHSEKLRKTDLKTNITRSHIILPIIR